jgi:hypothetical protein
MNENPELYQINLDFAKKRAKRAKNYIRYEKEYVTDRLRNRRKKNQNQKRDASNAKIPRKAIMLMCSGRGNF